MGICRNLSHIAICTVNCVWALGLGYVRFLASGFMLGEKLLTYKSWVLKPVPTRLKPRKRGHASR